MPRFVDFVVLVFIALVGCGGGGGGSVNPTPTPNPTPSPTPTPTPTQVTLVWEQSFAPRTSSALIGITYQSGVALAVGVENDSSNAGLVAYSATVSDQGATGVPSNKNFFSSSDPSAATAVALNGTTAIVGGAQTLPGGPTNTPAIFALSPITGNLIANGDRSVSCPASAVLPTAIATDPSTQKTFVGVSTANNVPVVVVTDASGNEDCAVAPIQVSDAGPNGSVSGMTISGNTLLVTGHLSGSTANSYVSAFDKNSGVQLWGVISTGPFGGTLMDSVVADANGFAYVGGTEIGTADRWVVVKLRLSDGSFATADGGWVANPVKPSQTNTADTLQALMLNTGTGGGIVAVGQTTPAGQSDPNNVQTSIVLMNLDGSVRSNKSVNVFPGKQEHVSGATSDGSRNIYLSGGGFTPGIGGSNFGWIAKFQVP